MTNTQKNKIYKLAYEKVKQDKKEEITAILKRTKKLDLVKAKAEQMLAQLQATMGLLYSVFTRQPNLRYEHLPKLRQKNMPVTVLR